MDNFITSADQWDSSKHSNFTADEFKCQGSGELKISSVVLDFVQGYRNEIGELLIISAIIALINRTNPLAASSLKNHLNGVGIYFNIFYLIKSSKKRYISFKVS